MIRMNELKSVIGMVGAALLGLAVCTQAVARDWPGALLDARQQSQKSGDPENADALWTQLEIAFPKTADWWRQDFPGDARRRLAEIPVAELERVIRAVAIEAKAPALQTALAELVRQKTAATEARWLELYERAAEQRRTVRLQYLRQNHPRIVFTKHATTVPSFFAYTEGQSDAQNERHFNPGSALCLLELDGTREVVTPLLEDVTGAIRDPAVSHDGKRVAFAWKKSLNADDYHLYELEVATRQVRQLTFGLGFADYEPTYLPNGDLVFASTRCVQIVDCWWTEVSNLYTCDRDGQHLRRLGFDQVHTVFPTVLDDGRIIYTRWDYNDRGQVFPQPLFQMNMDGTGQTEFYGNNSWFPTTIAHARGIPGTQKVLAIFTGHHSPQTGKLGIIDPARGRHEASGAQLVAPVRETKAERIDSYGQVGELFQYPYPLTEQEYLVTYSPQGWQGTRRDRNTRFAVYWMHQDGRRELLVVDPRLPCNQSVSLTARPVPALRPAVVDYRKNTGTYYIQDIYAGPGLVGVRRGEIRQLRVVALDFRAAGIGSNGSSGPGGGALISTPVAIGNGTWDVKTVLGTTPVHEDGSAYFTVPARTPVYFQALDARGRVVQTMRSWSTLQPGETQSCVGCHEHKNQAPPTENYGHTLALRQPPATLDNQGKKPAGFSFAREVQPILDRHCVRCHHDREAARELTRTQFRAFRQPAKPTLPVVPPATPRPDEPAFSLRGDSVPDAHAKRNWSDAYLILTQAQPDRGNVEVGAYRGRIDGNWVRWIGSQSVPTALPPYFSGSTASPLLGLLEQGHKGVSLSDPETRTLACWIDLLVPFCGDYTEANAWNAQELEKHDRYLKKRLVMQQEEARNIRALLGELAPLPR
jgi:hypothetical protein